MELQLLENGIDSLKSGVSFYGKYLKKGGYDEESYGLLKLTIICIHNSVEILWKKILSDVNDLLIYKDLSDFLLERLRVKVEHDDFTTSLDYYLTAFDEDVYTIDYNITIKRAKILFRISERDYQDMVDIGRLRNKITHFGTNNLIDFHGMLGVVNRTLQFILDSMWGKIDQREHARTMASLRKKILQVIEDGRELEEGVWGAFFSENFIKINAMFEEACSILEKEFSEEEFEFFCYHDEHIDAIDLTVCVFNSVRDELLFALHINNLPRIDASLLTGDKEYGPIYAVIDHTEENTLYIYKKPLELQEYEKAYKKFWNKDSKRCIRTEFDVSSIKEIIVGALFTVNADKSE